MLRSVVLVAMLLLAGCTGSDEPSSTSATYRPPSLLRATLQVVQPDGTPIQGAEAFIVEKSTFEAYGSLQAPRYANATGHIDLVYAEPTVLLIQVFGPGQGGGGWTREGLRLTLGNDSVSVDAGRVEGRTAILTLYRAALNVTAAATWSGAVPGVAPNGTLVPARLATDLAMPEPAAAYLARLKAARVVLTWDNNGTDFGDLYAGLAWKGGVELGHGEDTTQLPGTGARSESYQAQAVAPGADAVLQAVALTDRPTVGEVGLRWTATLMFVGQVPAELPLPANCLDAPCGLPTPELPDLPLR